MDVCRKVFGVPARKLTPEQILMLTNEQLGMMSDREIEIVRKTYKRKNGQDVGDSGKRFVGVIVCSVLCVVCLVVGIVIGLNRPRGAQGDAGEIEQEVEEAHLHHFVQNDVDGEINDVDEEVDDVVGEVRGEVVDEEISQSESLADLQLNIYKQALEEEIGGEYEVKVNYGDVFHIALFVPYDSAGWMRIDDVDRDEVRVSIEGLADAIWSDTEVPVRIEVLGTDGMCLVDVKRGDVE